MSDKKRFREGEEPDTPKGEIWFVYLCFSMRYCSEYCILVVNFDLLLR
jgi:hypothetical protein